MTAGKSLVFRFEDVEVREREFTLTKAGEVLPVEPKAFRVLLFLLHNPQTLITKEELLDAVWADAAVTESSLTRSIAKLRRVLGDDFQEPRYIATVATVGYRFVCKVEVTEEANENLGGIGEVPANGQAADANLPAHNEKARGITGQTISSDTQKPQSASEITKEVRPAARRLRWIPWGVAAALLPLLAWLGFTRWIKPPSPQRQSFRLSIQPPPSTSFVPYSLAVSPDGQRVAFVAARLDGATALWVRNLANGSFQQISGTEYALHPFWSADSREIGFSSGAKLMRADPSTGAVQVISNVYSPFGDTWNGHGTILFAGAGGSL